MKNTKPSLVLHGLLCVAKDAGLGALGRLAASARGLVRGAGLVRSAHLRTALKITSACLASSVFCWWALFSFAGLPGVERYHWIPHSAMPAPDEPLFEAIQALRAKGEPLPDPAARSAALVPVGQRTHRLLSNLALANSSATPLFGALHDAKKPPGRLDSGLALRIVFSERFSALAFLDRPSDAASSPTRLALRDAVFRRDVESVIRRLNWCSLILGPAVALLAWVLFDAAREGYRRLAKTAAKGIEALERRGAVGAAERLARSEQKALLSTAKASKRSGPSRPSL